MKVLLAKRRAMGDTVFLSSTIEQLQKSIPQIEISILVPAAYAPVLQGNPHLKNLYTYEQGFFSLLSALRKQRFDFFFQLHASPRTRWLAKLSGAREVHFHFQNNETEKAYGKHPNALEWDTFFLRQFLGEKIPLPAPMPKIFLSEQEKQEGREFWKRWGVDPNRVIFFGLGASRATKKWPPSHFARLAELLRERTDFIPALIPGPGEEEERFAGLVVDHFRSKGLRPYSEAGGKGDFIYSTGLSVRKLAQVLSASRAYVGNDSGPKHIAVAVGIPTLTFFGPEDPGEWHPYSTQDHPLLFLPDLLCRAEDNGRWCGVQECILEKHRCMMHLDPMDAFDTLSASLRRREDGSTLSV